jgi:polysaccharide biosynthesis transport protein
VEIYLMGSAYIEQSGEHFDQPFERPIPLISVAQPESRFLTVLKRRWALELAVTLVLFAVLSIALQFLPPRYQATSSVVVDSRSPRPTPVRGSEVVAELMPTPFDEDIIGTEVAIIRSRELVSQVVDKLQLTRDPHFNPFINPGLLHRFRREFDSFLARYLPKQKPMLGGGADQQYSDTVNALEASVKVLPLARSRVIEIQTTTWDPALSSNISNLIADLFVATHMGTTHELNTEEQTFLTQRLSELRAVVTRSAEAAESFRIKNGLISNGPNTLLQGQVSALELRVGDVDALVTTLQSRYDRARNANPEQLPEVLNSPTLERLREIEANAAVRRADILSRFGPRAPQLISFDRVLDEARHEIEAEAQRQRSSLGLELVAAKATAVALSARLSELRETLGKSEVARAGLLALDAESKAAESLYSAFLNRSMETKADLFFPSSDVRIVSRSSPPTRPSFPTNFYTMPAAALIALGCGVGCGLLVESRRKGLVSAEQACTTLQRPVLGIVPLRKGRTEGMYYDAIEDLFNRIYYGIGARTVLITSAFPGEGKSKLAQALADAATGRGLRVLLVDADLRSTSSERRKLRAPEVGLSQVLRGEVDAFAAVQTIFGSNLAMLRAGEACDNPTRLLSLPGAKNALSTLSSRFEFMIVDGPTAIFGGECWMLSQHMDQTIMTVKWAVTPAATILAALKHVSTKVGIVLNMVDPKKSRKLGAASSVIFDPALDKYRVA